MSTSLGRGVSESNSVSASALRGFAGVLQLESLHDRVLTCEMARKVVGLPFPCAATLRSALRSDSIGSASAHIHNDQGLNTGYSVPAPLAAHAGDTSHCGSLARYSDPPVDSPSGQSSVRDRAGAATVGSVRSPRGKATGA
jgi:hypothetical protein